MSTQAQVTYSLTHTIPSLSTKIENLLNLLKDPQSSINIEELNFRIQQLSDERDDLILTFSSTLLATSKSLSDIAQCMEVLSQQMHECTGDNYQPNKYTNLIDSYTHLQVQLHKILPSSKSLSPEIHPKDLEAAPTTISNSRSKSISDAIAVYDERIRHLVDQMDGIDEGRSGDVEFDKIVSQVHKLIAERDVLVRDS